MCLPGVYLHWPFCERKCPYCDFYTFGREHPRHGAAARFLPALIDEIDSAPERLGLHGLPVVDTIYFGGGTPSLMGPAALESILAALRRVFNIADRAELTMEVNPTTAEAAELPALLGLGINRLSVGAQSFSDRLLEKLGRVHNAATTRRALELIRAAGVNNLSLDLMFGVPEQRVADFAADLAEALAWRPEHLSAYNLTLHAGTPFARWHAGGRLTLPGEEAQLQMFELLMDATTAAGYEHYEISNWARPERKARHNSKYWRQADVYAFGPSAHGVVAGRRFANPPDLESYLDVAGRRLWVEQDAPATTRSRGGEIMMLALRRVEGVAWEELDAWLGDDAREFYQRELEQLQRDGLLYESAAGLRLTRAGILLADSAMERFF